MKKFFPFTLNKNNAKFESTAQVYRKLYLAIGKTSITQKMYASMFVVKKWHCGVLIDIENVLAMTLGCIQINAS